MASNLSIPRLGAGHAGIRVFYTYWACFIAVIIVGFVLSALSR